MLDWLARVVASTTTNITFFTIFLAGVGFSIFSLLAGGHGDHGVDHDIGHDGDMGAGDHADHGGHDGDADGEGGFSVGMFSVRGLALLSTGFGGIGFVIHVATGNILLSTVGGLLGGYAFAFAILYTLKVFKSQQSNSLVKMSSAVGGEGFVTVSIPADGLGEVSLLVSGVEMFKPARSHNGQSIQAGTRVNVSAVSGGALVVAAIERPLPVSEKSGSSI